MTKTELSELCKTLIKMGTPVKDVMEMNSLELKRIEEREKKERKDKEDYEKLVKNNFNDLWNF